MSIPRTDPALAAWSTNASTRLTAHYADYNMSESAAAAYAVVHEAYIASLAAVNTIGARSKALVADKNVKKDSLLKAAREIYATVQASNSISAENKTLLDVKIKKAESTPQARPEFAPLLSVEKVNGRIVTVRAYDAQSPSSRRRAPGTSGLMIFSHLGASAPEDVSLYKAEGLRGQVSFDVRFPDSVQPGEIVFITACWFNDRKEISAAASPVRAIINYPATIPTVA
jgi:hypothetical protein